MEVAHMFAGGRAALQDVIKRHPAVRFVAHDAVMDAAYVDPSHEDDLHERVAEVRGYLPRANANALHSAIITDLAQPGQYGWFSLQTRAKVPEAVVAKALGARAYDAGDCDLTALITHVAGRRRAPAQLRPVENAPLRRPLALARAALPRLDVAPGSEGPTYLNGVVVMPRITVTFVVEEEHNASALRMAVVLPIPPDEHSRIAFAAALARWRARWPSLMTGTTSTFGNPTLQFVMLNMREASVYPVEQNLIALFHIANAVGIPLTRIALGDAQAGAVEEGMATFVDPG